MGVWPVWTLLFCSAAVVVFFVPELQNALIYDRAAITSGEWWRLLTGNLIHHSTTQLIFDVVAFSVAGALVEVRRHAHFIILCMVAGACVGVVLYLAKPEMLYYAGLSGIVTALVVYLCLNGLGDTTWWRWLCAGALTLVVVKIGVELVYDSTLVGLAEPQLFVPMPLSHVTGAVTALIFFLLTRSPLCEQTVSK